MRQRILRPALGLLLASAMLTAFGCADKPTVPTQVEGPLDISIVAGPDASSAVTYGSKVTFKWQASGGSGNYTYKYSLDGGNMIDVAAGQTSVILSDPAVLTPGTHTFDIQVISGGNTESLSRSFLVGALGTGDTVPPTVTVVYPPVGYKAAPGSSLQFAWTVSDESNSTQAHVQAGVAAVGWAVDDTTSATTWTPSAAIPLAGFGDNLAAGTHTLFVKAVDNSGNVTVAEYEVDIIEPTILVVNEIVNGPGYSGAELPLSQSEAFARARYFDQLFSGYSWAEWAIPSGSFNYPTTADIPASVTTIVWVGSGDYQSTSWGWNVGWEYTFGHSQIAVNLGYITEKYDAPNVLTDWVDSGGKLWITGENWLDESGVFGVAEEGSFEYDYLGMVKDSATTPAHAEVIYDFAAELPGWPALASDIAKLPGGLGDYGGWMCDYQPYLQDGVQPLYRVSGYQTPDGDAGAPPEDDWYAAWIVNDDAGNPQVVFMGFDIYYFSVEAGEGVAKKILTDLFGN